MSECGWYLLAHGDVVIQYDVPAGVKVLEVHHAVGTCVLGHLAVTSNGCLPSHMSSFADEWAYENLSAST